MQQNRRRDRRPARRPAPAPAPARVPRLAGADIVLVGHFSGRDKDHTARMDAAARELTAEGARVVGRIVQRRGVSAGGAAKMGLPHSSRTVLSPGKAREAADLCARTGAGAAVFVTPLTDRQRAVLTALFGCPVLGPATARPE